jgi:hypothetical protein
MAKKKTASVSPKLTEAEQDLLSHMEDGYQLVTDSLGGNPVLRRSKDNEEIRPVSASRNTIKAMEQRGLISPSKRPRPTHYPLAAEKEAALVSTGQDYDPISKICSGETFIPPGLAALAQNLCPRGHPGWSILTAMTQRVTITAEETPLGHTHLAPRTLSFSTFGPG